MKIDTWACELTTPDAKNLGTSDAVACPNLPEAKALENINHDI